MTPGIAMLGAGAGAGAGAKGAGIGAEMVRAGFDVTFIEQWPAHVEAMRQRGSTECMPEETVVAPIGRVLNLCDVATLHEPFDLVFLLMKAATHVGRAK